MENIKMFSNIKLFLKNIVKEFPEIKFVGEFDSAISTFIINVTPLTEYKCNREYRKKELYFCQDFNEEFQGYDIIFVSDESINKVTIPDPRLNIHSDLHSISYENDSLEVHSPLLHNGYDINCPKYALAA